VEAELLARIERYARERMRDVRSSHGWDHVQRVRTLALLIGRAEGARLDVVEAAALLHDVGRQAEEDSGGTLCHARLGAEEAGRFLAGLGLERDLVEAVVHCVASHRFRDERSPGTLEARVLFDADKLDSIGAVGLGRAFLYAGEVGARLHNPESVPEECPARGPEDSALREFLVKLRWVRERVFTASGRRIAEQRHAFMEAFFDQLDREVRGQG
jgi:uncharacterized protein